MLFELYPDIKTAYNLTQQLRGIYNNNNDKHIAMTKLAYWYRNVEESGFKKGVLIRLCKLIYPSGESWNGAVPAFPRRGLKKEYLTNNLKNTNGNY
jgi:hypothetical protein